MIGSKDRVVVNKLQGDWVFSDRFQHISTVTGSSHQRPDALLLTQYPVLPVPGLNTTPAHRYDGVPVDEKL